MKLRQLRYFTVLAEELHFGRAAQRLAITQPPLSGAIKALETELGTPLFERSSKRVKLTPAGMALHAEAQQVLERMQRAVAAVRAVSHGLHGRLEVGVTGSLLYREPPRIVQRFQDTTPGVEILLRELSTTQQIDGLLRSQLDVGFINAATVAPQLACLPLADDQFVCCLPQHHPMAAHGAVPLGRLANEPFVMFVREVAPSTYDSLIAVFNQAGIHPRLVHAARQWLTVIAMVAHGMGIALVPASLARSRINGVVFVPLADFPTCTPAMLVWRPSSNNALLARFLDVARTTLAGEYPAGAEAVKAAATPVRARAGR